IYCKVMASTNDANPDAEKDEIVYKTKIVQFLGRSVPIILQNDNGPCPLLAICNVLLLRNNLSLGLDITEVASSRLLSLVAERLIDSNSNIEGKNEEYARNQQQNISDALPLLHHLVTGLDVNVRFRSIHDFEFTPECAVFDLLDIGLVHGWLCDPQDEVTSKILAPHSYNTLVEKLVELQATKAELQAAASTDTVDFAAATTATLGVPSPSRAVLLKTNSFGNQDANNVDDCLQQRGDVESVTAHLQRKGDVEENAQLLEALKISSVDAVSDSEQELKTETCAEDSAGGGVNMWVSATESESSTLRNSKENCCSVPSDIGFETFQHFPRVSENNECNQLDSRGGHGIIVSVEEIIDREGNETQVVSKAAATNSSLPGLDNNGVNTFPAEGQSDSLEFQDRTHSLGDAAVLAKEDDSVQFEAMDRQDFHAVEPEVVGSQTLESVSRPLSYNVDLDASPSSFSASSEPLYEGEAEISAGASGFESREPLYEGEANLAECAGQLGMEEEGAIISSFLKSNATQLSYFGLFCLQEGIKENELCVFFRNNHFSTMFKYKGDLYLLVTDQGYLSQPDIVWEKFDEVHGDTVFVTGTFAPFQAGENSGLWDEQGAIAATADYLSSHQQASSKGTTELGVNNSDFDLAMILQHEEFEQQQQQQQQQQHQQQPRTTPVSARQPQTVDSTMRTDSSRLITGPKKSSYSYKPETKSSSKCAIM
ncbi:hypothetical protein GOP47_0011254, partial [Adiantum capillus-veneris]